MTLTTEVRAEGNASYSLYLAATFYIAQVASARLWELGRTSESPGALQSGRYIFRWYTAAPNIGAI